MSTSYSVQRLLAALLAIPVMITFDLAPAQADSGARTPGPTSIAPSGEEELERSVLLADLGYANQVQVEFDLGLDSGDFGLVQTGEVNRNAPVVPDREYLLASYLEATPQELPVPRELLGAWPEGKPYPEELSSRRIVPAPVRATDLAVPGTAATATVTCWTAYYDPYHWYEPAGYPDPKDKFHLAKNFYSSQFGGMAYRARSFIADCHGFNRHRLYYKSGGVYYKQHDKTLSPWTWQAVRKGWSHRYRKVTYDAGRGYTRNGKFTG